MKKLHSSLLMLVVAASLNGCLFQNEENVPTVITSVVTNITETGATCGGTVTDDGNDNVYQRGVCWSTGGTPYTFNNTTSDGTGMGSFTSAITGLSANTTYYVRAYAINFIGTSYGETVSFNTAAGGNPGTVTDIDGNIYNTIQIGNQIWMKENLKTTRYRNGDAIPYASDATAWGLLTSGGYCYYDNLQSNFNTYGGLYNWLAASDSRNIAPQGWHVPAFSEWQTLINYLGGTSVAGGKIKETGTAHWLAPNPAGNSSDFTALGSGLRDQAGNYFAMYYTAYWWSVTDGGSGYSWGAVVNNNDETFYTTAYLQQLGFPIRCVKD